MKDKRIGMRIKQRRKELGFTQEQFAEMLNVSVNYISTIERGASFPRYDKLIMILNTLQTSADSIFCDVVNYSGGFKASMLSDELEELPPEEQKRIREIVEFLIKQARNYN